ncbi:MAG TPA: hypothetical protein VMF30_13020 [Pirellulales bacterium]|nr:hypothetical protein [Pirellulales bacterium]
MRADFSFSADRAGRSAAAKSDPKSPAPRFVGLLQSRVSNASFGTLIAKH